MDYQTFIPPKEAPILEPTAEEFEDPIAYIAKIRPIGEENGILKIRPPKNWKPPFSIDPEKLRFTPRVQTLNELEAGTRVKLNFLDALAKFWELQGSSLKVPNVERTPLDLHHLFKIVVADGGYDEVTAQKKWSEIGRKLDFQIQSSPASLKYHYEKVLYPYELFLAKHEKVKVTAERRRRSSSSSSFHREPSSSVNYSLRKTRRSRLQSPDMVDFVPSSNELKKLKFLCPGPKNSTFGAMRSVTRQTIKVERFPVSDKKAVDDPKDLTVATNVKVENDPLSPVQQQQQPVIIKQEHSASLPSPQLPVTPFYDETVEKWAKEIAHVESYHCKECTRGDMENELLICEGCDSCFHTFCLDPPLLSIPAGDWKCPDCVSKECIKPQESFGFEQASREYTLNTFGEMANRFKQSYFHMPSQEVPTSLVEREFWRILGSTEEDVTVEYGADLHSSENGSGFPTPSTAVSTEEQKYATCGWNLTNLANLPGSALSYVKANISGMKVPWLYVGMCFSSFCWHTEDHWIYSINYLHWGEPKTWYGVPPSYAEDLERVMMESAPELFENQPDLIHHLVTTISPNILMEHNIPVVRTNQCAGEFVVTFPRAYHAGFNQGFNFAEAVNFALPDWISLDRRSIEHYRKVRRTVVFSHEELLTGIAELPEKLEVNILIASYQEMKLSVVIEEERRQALCSKFSPICSKEAINSLSDDERQCAICCTTVFWSACECPCLRGKLICLLCMLEHTDCDRGGRIFKYAYTMDELKCQLEQMGEYSEDYVVWKKRVDNILNSNSSKPDYLVIRQLVKQGARWVQSQCEPLCQLQVMVQDAEMCSTVASQIVNIKCRTRNSSADPTLTLEELKGFIEEVENLPCMIPEYHELKRRLQQVEEFQCQIQAELKQCKSAMNDMEMRSSLQAVRLLAKCSELNVLLPELDALKKLVSQLQWLQKAEQVIKPDESSTTTNTLRHLSDVLKEGTELADNKLMTETCNSLKHLIKIGKKWEQKAQEALETDPPFPASYLTSIIKGVSSFGLFLPAVEVLQKVVDDANSWSSKADELERVEKPHLSAIEKILSKRESLRVQLSLPSKTQWKHGLATGWLENTTNLFVRESSDLTLLEVLLPREKSATNKLFTKKRRSTSSDTQPTKKLLSDLHGNRELETQRITWMEAEEWNYITDLRTKNERKQNSTQDDSKILYCHCRQPSSGCMVQCDLCLDWYHISCLARELGKPDTNDKYLCSSCQRSNRPSLSVLTTLLASLHSLPVNLTEGTALECLLNRASKWQKKAKEVLTKVKEDAKRKQAAKKQQEMQTALGKLQNFPDLAPLFKIPSKQGTTTPVSSPNSLSQSPLSLLSQMATPPPRPPVSSPGSSGITVATVLPNKLPTSTSPSVSPPSVQALVTALLAVNKNGNNNNGTVIKPTLLPAELRKELEEVMLRCDLLELTLEESKQLWQVLHEDELLRNKDKSPEDVGSNKKRKQPDFPASSEGFKKPKNSSDCEECSAIACLRPTDSTVNWVQCEDCQRWFHIRCVNLTYQEVKVMDMYKCLKCQANASKKTGVQSQVLQVGSITYEKPVTVKPSVVTGGFRPLLSIPNTIE